MPRGLNTSDLSPGERDILTAQAREIMIDFGPDADDVDEMELEDLLDALEG